MDAMRWSAVGLAGAAALRLWLCAEVPVETTDTLRNLGYGSHLLERGATLYDLKPVAFIPEPWTYSLPDVGFIYPPVTLVFYGVFGSLGLGIFYVKLALTFVELAVALAFARLVSPAMGLAYFFMPVSVWYVSHEGQFEPLVSGFLVLSILAAQRGRWFWSGCALGLALQTKQLAVFLLPWVVLAAWRRGVLEERALRWRGVAWVAAGLALSGLPFLGFYGHDPAITLAPLQSQSAVYNPFAWSFIDRARFVWHPWWLIAWNAFFSYLLLLLPLAPLLKGQTGAAAALDRSPFVLSWALIKSLNCAQFWYPIVTPALALCFRGRRRLVSVILCLMLVQCGRSLSQLLGLSFGALEPPPSVRVMRENMFRLQWMRPS